MFCVLFYTVYGIHNFQHVRKLMCLFYGEHDAQLYRGNETDRTAWALTKHIVWLGRKDSHVRRYRIAFQVDRQDYFFF